MDVDPAMESAACEVEDGPGLDTTQGCLAPEVIYHYTNAQGLLGIVSSGAIWASDIGFLNDSQEVSFAQGQLQKEIEALQPGPSSDPKYLQSFETHRNAVLGHLRRRDFSTYVSCFCENGNVLSQWRAYATDHGYAIGMKSSYVETALNSLSGYFGSLAPATYGIDGGAVKRAAAGVPGMTMSIYNHPGMYADPGVRTLVSVLATMKHPDFAEEREWRVVVTQRYSLGPKMAEPVKFRASSVAIVPFIEIPIVVDAIDSVRVGPGNNQAVRQVGAERLLSAYGSSAPVIVSETPLRS